MKLYSFIVLGLLTSSLSFAGAGATDGHELRFAQGHELRINEGHGSNGRHGFNPGYGNPGYGAGPGYGGPGYGHGPGRGGYHRPDRMDAIRTQQAFDFLNFAHHATSRYDFRRAIRQIWDAQFELSVVRNGWTQSANRRLNVAVERLNYALYRGDRRAYQYESNLAIRIMEDAKTDLWRSGLLRRH